MVIMVLMVGISQSIGFARQQVHAVDMISEMIQNSSALHVVLDQDPRAGNAITIIPSGTLVSITKDGGEIENKFSRSGDRIRGLLIYSYDETVVTDLVKGDEIVLAGRFLDRREGTSPGSMRPFLASHMDPLENGIYLGREVTPLTMSRYRVTEYVSSRLEQIRYPEKTLAKALILGVTDIETQTLKESFRTAGVSHLLALSGMHLEVVGSCVLAVLTPILGKRFSEVVRMLLGWGYVTVVGMRPSLVRAALGSTWKSVHHILRSSADPGRTLMFALFFQTILFPMHIYDISFMLSYAALAGIILESRRIMDVLPKWIPKLIREGIGMSGAAFLFTLPCTSAFFGYVYPIGIIASIPLGLLVMIFMVLSMILLVPIPGIAGQGLHFCLAYTYRIIVRTVEYFAQYPPIAVNTVGMGTVLLTIPIFLVLIRVKDLRTYQSSQNACKEYELGTAVRFSRRIVEIPR